MEQNLTLGTRIQTCRRRAGLSQEQLAERLGVSRQAVSKWELDESIPELDKALALCEVFEMTADELLRGKAAAPAPVSTALQRAAPACGLALVALGLVYICAAWYERQTAVDIAVGMAFQAVGLIVQYIAGLFERSRALSRLWCADFALCTFVPACLTVSLLVRGYPRPYLSFGVLTLGGFFAVYGLANLWFWHFTRQRR